MSDKQAPKAPKGATESKIPKTFEEWYLTATKDSFGSVSIEDAWNAAVEATRAEYDNKIKAKQAEINRKNRLLEEIGLFIRNKFIKTKEGQDLVTDKIYKELNQRGDKDE